jgi:hypothetical protein
MLSVTNRHGKKKWKECVDKVNSDRIPKQILKYQENDKRI